MGSRPRRESDIDLSVIICTFNPRPDYLSRVLEALRAQTLPLADWELLLVDNGSDVTLSDQWDLSWHPKARHVREDRVGLTHARICAIQQTSADLLVFVDDDNLLASEYLERALELAYEWPMLGAWGGECWPEFERIPDAWAREWWTPKHLGCNRWSNLPEASAATPCGAGMCVRRRVAEIYVKRLKNDPIRCVLGHAGTRTLGADDHDLSLTACDFGLGTGVFAALKLTHLIPTSRLEESYLLKMVEGMTYSDVLLEYFRGKRPSQPSRSQRLLFWYQSWWVPERQRRVDLAKRRGREAAIKEIEGLQQDRICENADASITRDG